MTADAIVTSTYHTISMEEGSESLPPTTIMQWTVEHCDIPLVGQHTFSIDDGMLCGVVESGVEHGREAGDIALRILLGELPAQIPVKTAEEGQSMLNLASARRLGIEVPQGLVDEIDVVITEEPTSGNP